MKKLISLLIAISCTCIGYSQLDFAPLGAKWYTRSHCPAIPQTSYAQFTVTEDSIIQSKYCTLIHTWSCFANFHGDIYVHQDGYEVFIFNEYDQEFQLIYDFSKQVGESWKVKVCTAAYATDTLIVIINEVDGIHRRAKILHSDSTVLYNNIRFGEGYGTEFSSGKLLLPEPINSKPPCTDELLCYEDPVEGLIYSIGSCVNTDTKQPDLPDVALTIFPNPAQQESTLQYELPIGVQGEVFIFDRSGKRLSQLSLSLSSGSLILPAYPAGLYFVTLFVDGRMVLSRRFIRI
ncbi:MAG: hypothetical protein DHS20C18_30140 [Saprospiraceae bacterium]|nr:MAG: hypothetical protein DHS20C18_30140 [Saprospiraceae bacterium]